MTLTIHSAREHGPRTLTILMSLLLIATAGPAHAEEALDEVSAFDIPEQALEKALLDFSKQAGIQIIMAAETVRDMEADGIAGERSNRDALEQLLSDRGLGYTEHDHRTIAVHHADRQSEAAELGNSPTASSLVLMAQNQTSEPQTQTSNFGETTSIEDDDARALEEIIVVGSRIRGAGVSVGSKVTTIDRQEIDQSGFATVQGVMHSLPQNFKGGINEDTRAGNGNRSGATSINLRGLGAGTTLTLVNGRRIPNGGNDGGFTDVSNIQASAIDRIDVLADGASAIYGSDAIGGVVNVVLRDDYDGAETRLRIGEITEGGSQQYLASQILGNSWDTGHALVSFEYFKRESLGRGEKPFSESSDLRSSGGDDFRTVFSVPGNITRVTLTDGTRINGQWAIPTGQDGTNLTAGDLLVGEVNRFNANPGSNLLGDQERKGIFATASQEVSENIELFAEGYYSKRDFEIPLPGVSTTLTVPSANPFFVDPLGGAAEISVRYNTLVDFPANRVGDVQVHSGVLGGTADLGNDWQIEIYGSYGRERDSDLIVAPSFSLLRTALANPDPSLAFNPFGQGNSNSSSVINSIIRPSNFQGTFDILTANIIADGTIYRTAGGDAKLAIGVNRDQFSFDRFSRSQSSIGILEEFDRDVEAVFGEILLPLIGDNNSHTIFKRLMLTASVRYEDYSDVGNTTNPKFGVLWTPIDGLDLRATWGSSFSAPDLRQLDESTNSSLFFPLPDPSSPTESTLSLILVGRNKDLKNETADTWTAGFDFSPPSVPGLEFDLTYYNIEFKDRITSARNEIFFVLSQEERFASAITRNPSQALIDEICNSGIVFDSGDLNDCLTTPYGAVVDLRLINSAVTRTDGLDFNFHYGFDTAENGRIDLRLGGTYILSFDEAFGPTAPIAELVDTIGRPIGLRLRNSVSWHNEAGLSAIAFLNYSGSYVDNVSSPERKIDSWTTADLTLAYDTGERFGRMGLNSTTFSLSVRNILNEDPPFVNNTRGVGYDAENASPMGRFVSFNIIKDW